MHKEMYFAIFNALRKEVFAIGSILFGSRKDAPGFFVLYFVDMKRLEKRGSEIILNISQFFR